MNIRITRLKITNFKGIKAFDEQFGDVTSIYGDNATGKTTVLDAFTWLLFGKDSEGKTQFNIKPLDSNNEPLHNKGQDGVIADHVVEGHFLVDGQTHVFVREFREKWPKRRGQARRVFSGHETTYYVDGVSKTQKEYQKKVAELLPIPGADTESIMRLLTSTRHFMSLPWAERRESLLSMEPDITNEDVAEGNDRFERLLMVIGSKKSLKEYRKEIASKIRKLKTQIDEIPIRISEVQTGMPEPVDAIAVNYEIKKLEKQWDAIDAQLSDGSRVHDAQQTKIMDLQNQLAHIKAEKDEYIHKCNSGVRKAKQEYQAAYDELRSQIARIERAISANDNERQEAMDRIPELQDRADALREKWYEEDKKQFQADGLETECPVCKRAFEGGDIEAKKQEMLAEFNAHKALAKSAIEKQGKDIKKTLADLAKNVESLQNARNTLVEQRDQLIAKSKELVEPAGNELSETQKEQIAEYDSRIKSLSEKIESQRTAMLPDVQRLRDERNQIELEIKQQEKRLEANSRIESGQKRIAELEEDLSRLSEELADLENQDMTATEFMRAKIDLIEARLNSRFKYVQWKMYEQQINEGERETCIALINGVPYEDANTAARINAGIDIINTFSEHFGVRAPIWVDHRESVVKLQETESQLINLVVSADDKTMRVAS